MSKSQSNAARRSIRSTVRRIALAMFIAFAVAGYAGATVYRLEYSCTKYGVFISAGTLRIMYFSNTTNNFLKITGLHSGWFLTRITQSPRITLWPEYEVTPFAPDLGTMHLFVLPLWLPLLPFLLLAALLVYRDRTRRQPGHCRKCGYNLTGNTSGRCPECGKPTGTNAPVASPPPSTPS